MCNGLNCPFENSSGQCKKIDAQLRAQKCPHEHNETIDMLITDIESWLENIDNAMPKLKSEIENRIETLKIRKEDLAGRMGKEKSYVSVSLKRHEISPENLIRIGKEVQAWNTNTKTSLARSAE